MRIWSLRPDYLDRQGLVACWRETLLAQAVIAGRTRGYTNHSQLVRFRTAPDPLAAVGAYLVGLLDEATRRGYRFDAARIDRRARVVRRASEPAAHRAPGGTDVPAAADDGPEIAVVPALPVTEGQIAYEWAHLMGKLATRSPERHAALREIADVAVHPLFVAVPGPVEPWERV